MTSKHGIFFDLDGTLVDNEHLKAQAFSDAIKHYGGKSHPSIYQEVMGMSGAVIRNHFIKMSGIQIDLEEYTQAYKSRYLSLIESGVVLKLGSARILNSAKEKGLLLALVSGASTVFVNYIVNTLDLNQFFDLIISAEDVANKKPNPDCYQLAMKKMSVSSHQAIVFEDTQAGLEAAASAGLPAICMRHTYNQSHNFSKAAAVYNSYDDDFGRMCNTINSIFNIDLF